MDMVLDNTLRSGSVGVDTTEKGGDPMSSEIVWTDVLGNEIGVPSGSRF